MFLPITGKPNQKGVILIAPPVPKRPMLDAYNTIHYTLSFKRPFERC